MLAGALSQRAWAALTLPEESIIAGTLVSGNNTLMLQAPAAGASIRCTL